MKRLLIYIIGVGLLMTACDIERSDNGDLDGLWPMTSKELLGTYKVNDMKDANVSWAFQGGMVQMNCMAIQEVTAQFSLIDNYLKIWNVNHFTHVAGDTKIDSVEVLYDLGIYQLQETFQVLELNKNTLRLQNDSVRLVFRKY